MTHVVPVQTGLSPSRVAPSDRSSASSLYRSPSGADWHSILRPHLAVHRTLSPGLLALLAVYHNHHVAARGVHAGQSPLQRSGLTDAPTNWLVALGYPPASTATGGAAPPTHPLPVLERAA